MSSAARRSIVFVIVALVLGAIAYTSKLRFGRDDDERIDPARDFEGATRRVLDLAVLQLESRVPKERRDAEQAVERLLIDREMAGRTHVAADGSTFSAATWYAREGAERVILRLLQRFDGAHETAEVKTAARLLTALAAAHPKASALALEGERLPDYTAHEPWVLAAMIANPKSKVAPYAIHRLLEADSPPGALFALALLRRLDDERDAAGIGAVLALLRRVEDAALKRLVAAQRPDARTLERPNDALLLADRLGLDNEGLTIAAWLAEQNGAASREKYLGRALASGDEGRVLHALDRIRWDPTPALDGKVQEFAAGPATNPFTTAAILALGSIPGRESLKIVEHAFAAAPLSDACRRVIVRWSGAVPADAASAELSSGVPLESGVSLEPWLRASADLAARVGRAEIDHTFDAGTPQLPDYRILAILATRGECDEAWYATRGARVVRGLDDPDPAVRTATIRALAAWEGQAVAPILIRRRASEENGAVAHALIDLLLETGATSAIPAVLRTLTDGASYHGVELVTTYALVFPETDLLEPIRQLARDAAPSRRAGAAYLVAGIPPQHSTEAGELLCEMLEDTEELPRFWAYQSLVRRYGARVEFDPQRTPPANAEVIARWRDAVRHPLRRSAAK